MPCIMPAPASRLTGSQPYTPLRTLPEVAEAGASKTAADILHADHGEAARLRQRAVAERLLLGALRQRDAARRAIEAEERATLLASTSRRLAGVLDPDGIREIVRRCTLPREGSWCIVDLAESNGSIHRLAVVHPDPAKETLARSLETSWGSPPSNVVGSLSDRSQGAREPRLITRDSGAALIEIAHGADNLAVIRELGFESLLVVPLICHDSLLGTMTFVTREGDAPLSAEEITLASDLAERCAIALDSAKLYAQVDARRATADRASHAKSAFLGSLSHELMTPLNAIGGYADLMELEIHGPITPEQRMDLERIKHSQQHLIALISGILEYVHSESGRVEFHPAHVPLDSLLDDVADMLRGAAVQKDLVLDVRQGDRATIWADPVRVRQVLVNLVTNAVKYTPAGGGRITLSTEISPNVVRVHVSDAGPGIPPEKLEAIFEPFVQLATGSRDRRTGVGLGLAISRDLAAGMKGELTVESVVGEGSRFTLTLPRRPA